MRWLQLRFDFDSTAVRLLIKNRQDRSRSFRMQWRNASAPAGTLSAVTPP